MDQWLQNLDRDTVIIVPTRSLANNLNEQIAAHKLAQGLSVWEAPNIFLWQGFIHELWQHNNTGLAVRDTPFSLITQQQALLLWTQVIAASRRDEQSLTLLNVQQTAKAVQRSWRLLNDWGVNAKLLADDHVADAQQFVLWVNAYRELLAKRDLLDDQLLANQLLQPQITVPYKKIIWYAYDLITAKQQAYIDAFIAKGLDVEHHQNGLSQPQTQTYTVYSDQQQELQSVFYQARTLIEQNANTAINIVIPDLQHRQSQVNELARDVFYASASPLQLQQGNTVYRFSLGEPLKQWPAIETAFTLIGLLKNQVKVIDLSFILHNRFLRHCQTYIHECRIFDQWLKRQRMSMLKTDNLVDYYQQCLMDYQQRDKPIKQQGLLAFLQEIQTHQNQFQKLLSAQKEAAGYAVLSFAQWVEQISLWLKAWGWSTSIALEEMNSVQFQLAQRWQALLKEFSELSLVQQQVGLNRALEILQQMLHDAVFSPKATASPILISGVYEAIGRPVDICFLTGMDDQYPQPAQADTFIANRLLQQTSYPEATTQDSFQQATKVIQSLLGSAQQVRVSYAKHKQQESEIEYQQTAIFRDKDFKLSKLDGQSDSTKIDLEVYHDINGPAWPEGQIVEGGSAIFKNQSNCAFKAFVTHQLKFDREDEAEFGLDNLDRGNIVHLLLDHLWGQIQTQSQLKSLSSEQRHEVIVAVVDDVINNPQLALNDDKKILLQHEKPRFISLLLEWLELEAARPTEFSVIEREEQGVAEYAGIRFRYIIDRLDMLVDGRTAIIDYKTGNVARNDWLGERIKDPQLPLYALAHDEKKRTPTSGIVFANVVRHDPKFVSLCEADIIKQGGWAIKEEDEWREHRAKWPELFTRLAKEFLAGEAQVNPIDVKTCDYCDLASVCRVSQLRNEAGLLHD